VKNTVLWCRLPSGRVLAYIGPLIQQVKTPWGAMRDAVTFMGMDDTNNWSRHKGYGGHWAENVTQAVARDIMADAMLRMDDLGWDVVLTVHDEVVCELPTASVSPEQYGAVMRTLADCYAGLPVAAEAVRAPRYRK
jgi:DNA polymerase